MRAGKEWGEQEGGGGRASGISSHTWVKTPLIAFLLLPEGSVGIVFSIIMSTPT